MSKISRPRRYPLLLPVRLWLGAWGKTSSIQPSEETVTANISSSGCYFETSNRPEVGSPVRMEIGMRSEPGKQSRVIAAGTVVRVENETGKGKTGVACKFGRQDIVRDSEK